jgi:calcium-dependent protein kinase
MRQSLESDYDILEQLGEGGQAVVKKCFHKPTGQLRALKILPKAPVTSKTTLRIEELEILRRLDHPNIVRCYDLLQDSLHDYIVMEYCEGGDLFSRINQLGKLSPDEAAKVMFQLLSCLSYCHARKIIHRDLKLENILLTSKGDSYDVKVADFGSSVVLLKNRKLIKGVGSAYYIAPEIIAKPDAYSTAMDVWSAGMTLYIMLTGTCPYAGTTQGEIIDFAKKHPFNITTTYTQEINDGALSLLTGMLNTNPRQRVTAAEALGHPWIKSYKSSLRRAASSDYLEVLKGFKASNKLREAVLTFLSKQAVAQEELKALMLAFQALDSNSDGLLSKEELVAEFERTCSHQTAEVYADEIIRQVDANHSGLINYTEFVKACCDKQQLLSLKHLEFAFSSFDKDGNGTLTSAEIREFVGGASQDDALWQEVINKVDLNGDGVIELSEFTELMSRSFSLR